MQNKEMEAVYLHNSNATNSLNGFNSGVRIAHNTKIKCYVRIYMSLKRRRYKD